MPPSLRGFLNSLRLRVIDIIRGVRFIDKVRLMAFGLLDSTPRIILRRLPLIESYIKRAKENLIKDVMINLDGGRLYCTDCESLAILSPQFESWMWRYIRSLKPGDVFIDVGAHIGRYTIPAARIVGESGLVIAIEPHPENYKYLLKNIKLNGLKNVIALNIAAWNSERDLKLFIGDVGGHHSAKKDFGLGSITVKARPLDDVVRDLRVKRVDLIKIDVEGAELEVLEGLVRTLKEHHPKVIVEVWRLETINEIVSRLGCRAQALTLEFPYYYLLEYGNP